MEFQEKMKTKMFWGTSASKQLTSLNFNKQSENNEQVFWILRVPIPSLFCFWTVFNCFKLF